MSNSKHSFKNESLQLHTELQRLITKANRGDYVKHSAPQDTLVSLLGISGNGYMCVDAVDFYFGILQPETVFVSKNDIAGLH